MVQPTLAVFGKKDYQQCRVLVSMVEQFNLPVELLLAETVRAADGLALSSRNRYLSAAERREAPHLFAVLQGVQELLMQGRRDYQSIEGDAIASLVRHAWQPDYVSIRKQSDCQLPGVGDKLLVVLAAARLGRTRLIDNVEIQLPADI